MADWPKIFAAAGLSSSAAAALTLAVTQQLPVTAQHEGMRLEAYQDTGGVWTICSGDTEGVKPGMVLTLEQCLERDRQRLNEHTLAVLVDTPVLAENVAALRQAGDFHYNAGPKWWAASPMRTHFRARRWRQGCEAFRGYIVLGRVARPIKGEPCRMKGKTLYCKLPGLVKRREDERSRCLAGQSS